MNFHFEEIEHGDIKFFFVNPHILRCRFQKSTHETAPETPSLSKLDFFAFVSRLGDLKSTIFKELSPVQETVSRSGDGSPVLASFSS